MPLFDHRCPACDARFEELVRMDEQVPCPHCGAFPAERLLSAFAVSTASGAGDRDPACAYGAPQPAACGACGDPRGPGACSL